MNTNARKNALVIILHEIYGVNDHTYYYRDMLVQEGYDVLTPDLLHGQAFTYDQDEQAYHFFVNEIGFDQTAAEVKQMVLANRERYDRIFLMGFSVGATLAWMNSEIGVDGIIGFYGSRIRNHLYIVPECPALLFFANHEKSFDVLALAERLQGKSNTTIEVIEGEHGFMNPFHPAYKSDESMTCIAVTKEFLHKEVYKVGANQP
ncbi:dienelactone hydrolase family protein [Paenibacillus terrigena]|uniref:dienelactone hydrolase family protein n=1 Tax=Paenibacillus terrigena TaxID=369333 RepID=UPI00036646F2|nr:dienelactone hydrolase family protein [Paenibacillus terrigena]